MRNQVFKKLFSVLLALIMVAGLLPASAMAGGWGAMDVETTPVPTGTVQPTESAEPTAPTETETPEVTEVPEPTPENPAATVEPTQGEPTAELTDEGIMPANVMPVQATTEISYVKKEGSGKRLNDDTFYRIFLLDCGRKYFTVDEINGIIDQLAKKNYTHIELAFGNEGLRFLLDDMSLEANGVKYDSETIKNAIKYGNQQFNKAASNYNPTTNEWTQDDMEAIFKHAAENNIGIIPLFNSPGHLYSVIQAMNSTYLNLNVKSVVCPNAQVSPNRAINPTEATAVNFVQALLEKYVLYFKQKGCTMFNIGADESGVDGDTYSAYAKMVNSCAAIVQNNNMVALAFNDGINHPSYIAKLEEKFDTNIAICYWDAGGGTKYAQATDMAGDGFKIISTHNAWYYVLGINTGNWATYQQAEPNTRNVKCTTVDGGATTDIGCTLAVWCDIPSNSYSENKDRVFTLINNLSDNNTDKFVEVPNTTPTVTVKQNNVKEVTKTADNTYKVVLNKATGDTAESQTLQLTVANGAEGAVYTWKSSDEKVATVDENGKVTFTGTAGTVTITATPAATKGDATAAYSITLNVEVEGEVKPEEETITITVGQDATRKQDGKAEITSEYDTSVVTINTEVKNVPASTGEPTKVTTLVSGSKYIISDGNGNYLKRNGTSLSNVSSPDEATEWTVKKNDNGWLISDGDYYYLSYYNDNNGWGLYVKTYQTQVTWAYDTDGSLRYYTQYNNAYYYIKYNNGWTVSSGKNGNVATAWEKGEATPGGDQTTITFHGEKVGETTVVIGNVKYIINVIPEDLSNAKDFYIQLWFTNVTIESENTSVTTSNWTARTAKYITVKAGNAYGESGVPLSQLVPTSMERYEYDGTYWIAVQSGKDAAELIYLKGKALNGTSQHQYVWSTDRCNDSETGIEFQYVRYYKGIWQVSNDRTNWSDSITAIQNDPSESNSYQVVAYYTMRTKVVDEIYTDITEWPTLPHTKLTGGYCLLDYRVVYASGLTVPSTFPADKKTMSFACGNGVQNSSYDSTVGAYYRKLNQIDATAIQGYEIYMVTLTPTSDTATVTVADSASGATSYVYNGTEKVVWVDDEANLPTKFQSDDRKYTSSPSGNATTYHIGGTPNLESVEIYEKQGLLVTYYIRPVVTNDTLTVHYRIDGSNSDFHHYNIGVKSGVTFKEGIKLNDPWKGNLLNGGVPSLGGKTEWVSSDLYTMPQIDAVYRFADYKCVRVERSEDGKDVYLYYKFNYTKTFVVDFGLPLIITPESVSESLAGANIEKVAATYESEYADVEVSGKNVIYRLKTLINGSDQVVIEYSGTNLENGNAEGKITFNIQVIPATNVYYEDSFAKFTNGSGTAAGATWTIFNNNGDTLTEQQQKDSYTNQALEALGTKENVYGYDRAYQNSTMFSMGSARKVTVTQDMVTNWNDATSAWPTAQFTFKGTGFDIISLTDNTSGAIFVEVVGKTKGITRKLVVNNYYGYEYDDATGKWNTTDKKNPNTLYQIPVMAVRDLEYDEYDVTIRVAYGQVFDKTGDSKYSFWLDAVRVYDPMGVDNDIYNTENEKEGYPQYIKLRNELAKDAANRKGVVFIDGAANANIALYANYGPNNEVYLAEGQAITFALNVADGVNIKTIQIAAKAPNGEAYMAVTGDTKHSKAIGTATEMYYELDEKARTFTIANTGVGILSLTNVKITYAEKATVELGSIDTKAEENAVQAVRALFASAPVEPEPEPEPEKTFEPERFEASWSKNVMQGRKATLTVKTSEDVEAITVDGQTIRSYRTRTERVGFGRRAKRITYREFTYSMVAQESADFSVTAINAEGTESEAITARLTVKTRPNSMRDMWDWFKGWF